jgi:hypothetical protein
MRECPGPPLAWAACGAAAKAAGKLKNHGLWVAARDFAGVAATEMNRKREQIDLWSDLI